LEAFVSGGANLMNAGYGLPASIGTTLLAVMAVLFAATTMDTGVRLQRYIIQEWGQIYGIDWLLRKGPATALAVGCCAGLAFGAGGPEGTGGLVIWPLFGTTNQLLAALTLLVVGLLVARTGRTPWPLLVPMLGLIVMTIAALLYQLLDFWRDGNWFLAGMDLLILVAAVMVALETASTLIRSRRQPSSTAS
ncbi:MAG: carbon starvation CstA family protein, partial [Wenzhouxiangella sp.]